MRHALVVALSALVVACGSTGSDRFEFEARAHGVTPPAFINANGWSIALTRANFTLGPVYLKAAAGRDDSRTVGEVLDRITVDALSPDPVPFSGTGTMTEAPVLSGEIWLAPAAVDFEGTAARAGIRVHFRGRLVLDDAWASTARPGEHSALPIGEIRKARAVPASFFPREGGALDIGVDARGLFAGADFGATSSDIELTPSDQVMKTVFAGIRAARGTWEIEWVNR